MSIEENDLRSTLKKFDNSVTSESSLDGTTTSRIL